MNTETHQRRDDAPCSLAPLTHSDDGSQHFGNLLPRTTADRASRSAAYVSGNVLVGVIGGYTEVM